MGTVWLKALEQRRRQPVRSRSVRDLGVDRASGARGWGGWGILGHLFGHRVFSAWWRRVVDLVEGFDGEENGLHGAGLHGLAEDGFEGKVADLAASLEDAGTFGVRADEAAAVDLELTVLADDPELDG